MEILHPAASLARNDPIGEFSGKAQCADSASQCRSSFDSYWYLQQEPKNSTLTLEWLAHIHARVLLQYA